MEGPGCELPAKHGGGQMRPCCIAGSSHTLTMCMAARAAPAGGGGGGGGGAGAPSCKRAAGRGRGACPGHTPQSPACAA